MNKTSLSSLSGPAIFLMPGRVLGLLVLAVLLAATAIGARANDPKDLTPASSGIGINPLFANPMQLATKPTPPRTETPTAQVLYQFLIAEIAGQRGQSQLAARGMLDLAGRTQDVRVARRAAEIAFQTRQSEEARNALLLWLELEPESSVARQALAALLGTNGPVEKVLETMSAWLAEENAGKKIAPALFVQMPYLLARHADRKKVADAVVELTQPFQGLAEAHYARAVTSMLAGNRDAATAGLANALKMRPDFSRAAIAMAQLIRSGGIDLNAAQNGIAAAGPADEAAARFLSDFLKRYPDATDVRIAYARLLVGMKALLEARESFRRAANEYPLDAELPYAVGLLSLQIEDWIEAEKQFKHALTLRPRDKNPIYFNLALVAEGKKDQEGAMEWYRQIRDGEYFVSAQLKIASHLAKQSGFDAGRNFLKDAQKAQAGDAESAAIRIQLVLAEIQMLREKSTAKEGEIGGKAVLAEAFQVLTAALITHPESVELRYDRAMIAEKMDDHDTMEKDLRAVVKTKPDHAHALNALGYSFADRGIRLNEAYELIQKAVSLSPDDPFIQDSLGWVQFKMGREAEALVTLEKAHGARPDPEIAAHLGEVMWRLGKRSEAIVIWKNALKELPGNTVIKTVMERLAR